MSRASFLICVVMTVAVCAQSVHPQSNVSTVQVTREQREQAFVKLLEGQRHLREMLRARGQAGWSAAAKPAKAAFQEAVRLDPTLAEAYTALSELTLSVPPNDIQEALNYARLAVQADKNNFGANRIQARLFTLNSGVNDSLQSEDFRDKAIESWRKVAELDPTNAEAWAFLSEFYKQQGKSGERIDALRKWLASASPSETRFYQSIFGQESDLSPEAAGFKLGDALLDAGRIPEAVEVLNNYVADAPDDTAAVDLLRQALDLADAKTGSLAIQTLEQAVFANPKKIELVGLLARILARAGRVDEAVKLLSDSASRVSNGNASELKLIKGEVLLEASRSEEAAKAFESALPPGLKTKSATVSDTDRDFFVDVTDRIVRAFKFANRFADARSVLETAATKLPPTDTYAEVQLITVLRETGRSAEALQRVRTARLKLPNDSDFLKAEARILAESGKIEDAVKLMRQNMGKPVAGRPAGVDEVREVAGKAVVGRPVGLNDFGNLLFISTLYSSNGRFQQAVEAAEEARALAGGDGREMLAELAVASAKQRAGKHAEAEAILKKLLGEVPGNPIALNNLGYLYAQQGRNLEEAEALILRAVKTDPGNPSYLDSLGWAYARQGKNELARDYLTRALILDPVSPSVLEHLGDVQSALGDERKAKEFWERALALSRDPKQLESLGAKIGKRPAK